MAVARAHTHPIRGFGLAVSPADRSIAVGASTEDGGGFLVVREPDLLTERSRVLPPCGEIWSVEFTPDGRGLLVGADRCMALWDSGLSAQQWKIEDNALSRHLAIGPANLFAEIRTPRSGAGAGDVRVYDVEKGRRVTTLHSADTGLQAVAFVCADRPVAA